MKINQENLSKMSINEILETIKTVENLKNDVKSVIINILTTELLNRITLETTEEKLKETRIPLNRFLAFINYENLCGNYTRRISEKLIELNNISEIFDVNTISYEVITQKGRRTTGMGVNGYNSFAEAKKQYIERF
jgi:hypothetical protein